MHRPPSIQLPQEVSKGPDLNISYYVVPGDIPGSQVIIRSSYGIGPAAVMNRHDVIGVDGKLHDWEWDDLLTRTTWRLIDPVTKKQGIAAAGKSEWAGKGPTIPASANCIKCHDIASAKTTVVLEPRFGPVEAFLAPRVKVQPKPVKQSKVEELENAIVVALTEPNVAAVRRKADPWSDWGVGSWMDRFSTRYVGECVAGGAAFLVQQRR